MVLILHMSDDNCVEKNIILITVEYSGLTVEFHQGCKLGLCDKAPEYLKFLAQEPFLEIHETQLDVADGTIVIGANNIARFLCKKYKLVPRGQAMLQKVFSEQFIGFSTRKVYQRVSNYYNDRHKVQPPASIELENKTLNYLKNALAIFNHRLGFTILYLVAPSFTAADIIVTCHLHFAFTNLLNKSFTSQFVHVEGYFWYMVNQPNFQKILGNVEQAD